MFYFGLGGQWRFWVGAVAMLVAAVTFLLPIYRNPVYFVPWPSVFVSWYRNNAFWPALTHEHTPLTRAIHDSNVLLLGSSKTLYGLSASTLTKRFRSQNIKFFNLGIVGGEGSVGANKVINDLDLHDKILGINIDDNMLSNFSSPQMKAATKMDWFQAESAIYSVRANATIETLLDHVGLPQLKIGKSVTLRDRLLPRGLRSLTTGDSPPVVDGSYSKNKCAYKLPPALPHQTLPRRYLNEPGLRRIMSNWMQRGMKFVFFVLPYGSAERSNYTPAMSKWAAERYGGVAIPIEWRGLTSCDHIHLERASKAKATQRLADGLAAVKFTKSFATLDQ